MIGVIGIDLQPGDTVDTRHFVRLRETNTKKLQNYIDEVIVPMYSAPRVLSTGISAGMVKSVNGTGASSRRD
jgi:hypothetical protein